MNGPVISVRNVSKAYNIYASPRDAIKEALFGGIRHDVFWALDDVSFEVEEGQRIGIIGPNGAGKTTLLSLITGNLTPTSGSIEVHGRISAMLSLTSFLNPEETGLENIRFNLLVNGFRRGEIATLAEEIVDFTELGAFIHAPVRTYSSGMNARLAFAISTVVSPDILVVDEVLGAGDAYFVGKATQRMIELCSQGRALLFVSHSLSAVQLLCNTAIWLDGGVIRELGPVEQVVRRYEDDFRRQEDEATRSGNRARRERLLGAVRPEEFARPDVLRFRVTAPGTIHDQHYVRRLSVALGERLLEVPLELATIDDAGVEACLDVAGSEWGRPHERLGSESRALAPSSSRLRGGHVLIRRPQGTTRVSARVELESTSLGGEEHLVVQYVDPATGGWIDLETVERESLGDGWETASYAGVLDLIPPASHAAVLERIVESNRPDVELLGAVVLGEEGPTDRVREHEPFSIAVSFRANRRVPIVDVGIRIIRADGVYVFWQSSGEGGGNLVEPLGERTVTFRFEPNLIGAGDFEVTAYVANGFDVEANYPYSEVYDRRVQAARFTIQPKEHGIDYGVLNQRIPVTFESEGTSEANAGGSRVAALAEGE